MQAGTYLEQSGSAGPCLNCAIAKALYDPGLDASAHDSEADCVNCDAGFYGPSAGMAECDACVAGKYLEYDSRDDYLIFHDEESDCKVCDAGTYAPSNGTATCIDYDTGYG